MVSITLRSSESHVYFQRGKCITLLTPYFVALSISDVTSSLWYPGRPWVSIIHDSDWSSVFFLREEACLCFSPGHATWLPCVHPVTAPVHAHEQWQRIFGFWDVLHNRWDIEYNERGWFRWYFFSVSESTSVKKLRDQYMWEIPWSSISEGRIVVGLSESSPIGQIKYFVLKGLQFFGTSGLSIICSLFSCPDIPSLSFVLLFKYVSFSI